MRDCPDWPRPASWSATSERVAGARPRPGQQPLLTACDIDAVLHWYRGNGRALPWRASDRSPWGVLVCEVMSQQTPVARIVGPWREWLARWPTPADLAAASPAEAIRMWGRLGYPRRALRLHAAAVAMVERHGGQVPGSVAELLALPGIGGYTAAATAAFGFGIRATVLDVNIRRVLDRVAGGAAGVGPTDGAAGVGPTDGRAGADGGPGMAPPVGSPTRAEVDRAGALLPSDPVRAAAWNAAVMELGALVCVARAPRCPECPLAASCRTAAVILAVDSAARDTRAGGTDGSSTHARGSDGSSTRVRGTGTRTAGGDPKPRRQPWVGTDRYVRGLVMARLRDAEHDVARTDLDLVWPDGVQLGRCVDSLIADGLAVATADRLGLPGPAAARQA